MLHDIRRGIPFDLSLERALRAVPETDRGLAHEIAAGALRYRSVLDAAIAPHLDRGPERIREDLLDILRLGVGGETERLMAVPFQRKRARVRP